MDDPEGFHTELISDVRAREDQAGSMADRGASASGNDPEVSAALLGVARHEDSRECLVLSEAILETPELLDRLDAVLKPQNHEQDGHESNGCRKLRRWEARRHERGNILPGLCFCVGFLMSLQCHCCTRWNAALASAG